MLEASNNNNNENQINILDNSPQVLVQQKKNCGRCFSYCKTEEGFPKCLFATVLTVSGVFISTLTASDLDNTGKKVMFGFGIALSVIGVAICCLLRRESVQAGEISERV